MKISLIVMRPDGVPGTVRGRGQYTTDNLDWRVFMPRENWLTKELSEAKSI